MSHSYARTSANAVRPAKTNILRRFLSRFVAANALHRQHQALLNLDDALLSDIGITRRQAETMAAQPIWDAPTHWKG